MVRFSRNARVIFSPPAPARRSPGSIRSSGGTPPGIRRSHQRCGPRSRPQSRKAPSSTRNSTRLRRPTASVQCWAPAGPSVTPRNFRPGGIGRPRPRPPWSGTVVALDSLTGKRSPGARPDCRAAAGPNPDGMGIGNRVQSWPTEFRSPASTFPGRLVPGFRAADRSSLNPFGGCGLDASRDPVQHREGFWGTTDSGFPTTGAPRRFETGTIWNRSNSVLQLQTTDSERNPAGLDQSIASGREGIRKILARHRGAVAGTHREIDSPTPGRRWRRRMAVGPRHRQCRQARPQQRQHRSGVRLGIPGVVSRIADAEASGSWNGDVRLEHLAPPWIRSVRPEVNLQWQIDAASDYGVTRTSASSFRRSISVSWLQNVGPVYGIGFPVGSSTSNSSGPCPMARAMATRWRSPPDNSDGNARGGGHYAPEDMNPGLQSRPFLNNWGSFSATVSVGNRWQIPGSTRKQTRPRIAADVF